MPRYEMAWVMFDGSFDSCGIFFSLEELHSFAKKQIEKYGHRDYVWRAI